MKTLLIISILTFSNYLIIAQSEASQIEFDFDSGLVPGQYEAVVLNNGLFALAGQEGTFTSEVLSLELHNPQPFISLVVTGKTNVADPAQLQFSVRTSPDNISWNNWLPLSREDHLHRKDDHENPYNWQSETLLLSADTRFIQVSITLFDVLEVLTKVSVHLHSPGIVDIDEFEYLPSSMNCPCDPLPYVSRTEWGCLDGQGSSWTPVSTTITHMIVHHAAGYNYSPYASAVLDIWYQHAITQNWGDTGYGWLIDPDGVLYQGRAWSGTNDDVIGAHMCHCNANKFSVCLLGNLNNTNITSAQYNTLVALLAWKGCDAGLSVTSGENTTSKEFTSTQCGGSCSGTCWTSLDCMSTSMDVISGHRDGCKNGGAICTDCPGNNFYPQLPQLRLDVADFIDGCQPGGDCTAPVNNTCPGAIELTMTTLCNYVSSTTCGATDSGFSTCFGDGDDDVFFMFVAMATSATIIVDGDSGNDMVIQGLSGACGGGMVQIGCVDDTGGGGVETMTLTGLTIGTTYYLRVYEYYSSYGNDGNFVICVYGGSGGCPPPINDSPCNAITVTCGNSYFGDTECAAEESGFSTCGTSIDAPGVWYQFTGNNQIVTFTTCNNGTSFDTKINAFTGACGSLDCLDGNDDDGNCEISGLYSTLSILSTVGTTYYILVQGFNGEVGEFELSIECEGGEGGTAQVEANFIFSDMATNDNPLSVPCGVELCIEIDYLNDGNSDIPLLELEYFVDGASVGTDTESNLLPDEYDTENLCSYAFENPGTYEFCVEFTAEGNQVGYACFPIIVECECVYELSSYFANFGSAPDIGSVSILTDEGCAWSVFETCDWISFFPAGGVGPTTLTYTVSANPTSETRDCQINIGDEVLLISQDGLACSYALVEYTEEFTENGGIGNFVIATSTPDCFWQLSESCDWVTVSQSEGFGTTNITYTVTENNDSEGRICILLISGMAYTISQEGQACLLPAQPEIQYSGNLSLCDDDNIALWVNVELGSEYIWNLNGEVVGIGGVLVGSSPGLYWVSATNECGVVNSEVVQVDQFDLPPQPILSSYSGLLCPDGNIEICCVASEDFTTVWSNGATGTCATLSEPGTYYAVFVNNCGTSLPSEYVVVSDFPTVTWLADMDDMLLTDSPIQLTGGVPAGGTYDAVGCDEAIYMDGLGEYWFNPSECVVGPLEICYSYSDGDCADSYCHVIDISTDIISDVSESVRIFPNPAKGGIHIGNAPQGSIARIYNSLGMIVLEVKCDEEIYLNDLSPGLYHVNVYKGNFHARLPLIVH